MQIIMVTNMVTCIKDFVDNFVDKPMEDTKVINIQGIALIHMEIKLIV